MSGGALICDLDGTLLWLDVAIEPAREGIARMFATRGYRGRFRPILPEIAYAARTVAASDAERVALIARARAEIDRVEMDAARRARPRAGAAALLERAEGLGWRLGIVTDNGRTCVRSALTTAGLGGVARFAAMVSRDDVMAPKPDPEGLLMAIHAMMPGGERVVWVGDSPRDVDAGHAARLELVGGRMQVVALTGGRGRRDSLEEAGADHMFDELGQVEALLD